MIGTAYESCRSGTDPGGRTRGSAPGARVPSGVKGITTSRHSSGDFRFAPGSVCFTPRCEPSWRFRRRSESLLRVLGLLPLREVGRGLRRQGSEKPQGRKPRGRLGSAVGRSRSMGIVAPGLGCRGLVEKAGGDGHGIGAPSRAAFWRREGMGQWRLAGGRRCGRWSKPKSVVEASIHGDGRWSKMALEIEGQVQHLRGEKTEEHARVDIIGPGGDLLQERRRELRKGRTGSHHG